MTPSVATHQNVRPPFAGGSSTASNSRSEPKRSAAFGRNPRSRAARTFGGTRAAAGPGGGVNTPRDVAAASSSMVAPAYGAFP